MTSMGISMSSGNEVFSLTHRHQPPQPPCLCPPVSFREEWGKQQRERRRGATYGRAKLVSNKLSWAENAHKLISRKRPIFCHATRPKTKPPSLPNRPNIKLSYSPKCWSDLVRITELQSFVNLKFQNLNCLFSSKGNIISCILPSEFDCCVLDLSPEKKCPPRRLGTDTTQQLKLQMDNLDKNFEILMEKDLTDWTEEVEIGKLAEKNGWKMNQ